MRQLFIFFLFSLVISSAKADSPLTSTTFYNAYLDVPIIKKTVEKQEWNKEVLDYLKGPNDTELKMALINALGWGKIEYANNYKEYLKKEHGLDEAFFDSVMVFRGEDPGEYPGTEKLTQDEMLCMAYLYAMGDYFNPIKSHYLAWHSYNRGVTRIHAIIYGLIIAQYNLDMNWCYVYEVMVRVRDEPLITVNNMKQEAIDMIFDYINIYEESCVEEDVETDGYEEVNLVQEPIYYNRSETPQKNNGKKDCAELIVEEILMPEYMEEFNGTRIRVIIVNKGSATSVETNALLKDVDLSAAEAKKAGLTGSKLQIASEAEMIANNPDSDDSYFESWAIIPMLGAGQRYVIDFFIYDHWIFDPNCEIKLELDYDRNIDEPNEKNNVMYFVAGG